MSQGFHSAMKMTCQADTEAFIEPMVQFFSHFSFSEVSNEEKGSLPGFVLCSCTFHHVAY